MSQIVNVASLQSRIDRGSYSSSQMNKNNKYILPVRADIIREIGKRGIKTMKKDETGIVRKNPRGGTGSSAFGWGTVDDTIPIHKKELKDIKRNLNAIINQIGGSFHPLEREPINPIPTGKRAPTIDVDALAAAAADTAANAAVSTKRIRIPHIIEEWHTDCTEHYEKGMLGFVPECYHSNGIPPLQDLAHTTVGQVLLHFANFNKMLW